MKAKKRFGVGGIIVPTFIEPNGKMEKFLEVARNPKVQKEYEILLKELKCKPEEFSRKLREVVWKGKSVDEIFEELGRGRSR
jgi:hypothetical protein